MSSSLLPGARLGRYEIKSQLGAGGMGEVYLAHDTKGYWEKRLDLCTQDMKRHYVDPYDAARFSSRLGDKDQAIGWLQKGYEERVEGMTLLNVEPDFDALHSDPRFQELVRKVGLAQ